MSSEFLWYIPNEVRAGHRGDTVTDDHHSLDTLVHQAQALERHGWTGALIGTGWGRPDTFTIATALAVLTTRFEPLVAVRPGFWSPAPFASAAATLDQLSRGRLRVNVVSGRDAPAAYGDHEDDPVRRYARTREFLQLVRRLWTEDDVTYHGKHYQVTDATLGVKAHDGERTGQGRRRHPTLYFGGASEAAERVAAAEADVQLFWGETLDGVEDRIQRLRHLGDELGREHPPLEFGLRITTLVRDTTEQAWADAEAKVAVMAGRTRPEQKHAHRATDVGQRRLDALARKGEVLDENLYTAPARLGGGGAGSTWLVGSAEDVARSLRRYEALGVSHFILSDTPYLAELQRQGHELLPLLQGSSRTQDP